jgi:hypothetical protein
MKRFEVQHAIKARLAGILLPIGLFSIAVMTCSATPVSVFHDDSSPQISFAVSEIHHAYKKYGNPASFFPLSAVDSENQHPRLVLATLHQPSVIHALKKAGASPSASLQAEGFCLRVTQNPDTVWVIGYDEGGAMYGGLEVAEWIRIGQYATIQDLDQNPYMPMRGTKFNIPLDARTPSYSDVSDAAQQNIAEMWNFDFWKEYIDNLARHRYNYISLWSLHPFPSLVKVPDYPDIALDDVKRSTVAWKEDYSLEGIGFDSPEILQNLETLKKISMDEKIEFWRKVMRYGKERNIDFYVVTWNIFVNGTDGKYGITDRIENKTTIDYFRKSVEQMFLTYPDLAGIGLTTGENMKGADFKQKEDWAFRTYAQGVLDASKKQPGRKIRFIHRQHMAGAKEIAAIFKPLIENEDIDFIFSFKYAQAHVYSSVNQIFHQNFVKDVGDIKTIWTLRNDDIYRFRWGAPAFVREFIQKIPYEVSQGFYYGSDQYIWGREFMSLEPESPRQLEIDKHWYHWLLWGRLGYDPHLRDERFIQILQARYPEIDATKLFTAWQEASMIYPKTTGFHWGALDFQWYIEACKSRPGPAKTETGFHDVNRFITLPPHAGTGYASIPKTIQAQKRGEVVKGLAPDKLADQIHTHADTALALLDTISYGDNKELRQTLDDIRTIAYLGKYYAHKIHAAYQLALYRENLNRNGQTLAIAHLSKAATCWRYYSAIALAQYSNPLWTNRVGYCDWRELMGYAIDDIVIAGEQPQFACLSNSMQPTHGGTLLEAEKADIRNGEKSTLISGHTGSGYVDFETTADIGSLEWQYRAPQSGTYLLEVRYTRPATKSNAVIFINDSEVSTVPLWSSGAKAVWLWDRAAVQLEQGDNTIRLHLEGEPLIDHVNVIYAGPSTIE